MTARQGMKVSIIELKNLIIELEENIAEMEKFGSMTVKEAENKKFSVNIINKTPECSDTWELEK